jgi:L-alanine-DL-glutamate epimerase-like enolase superfamily enzyme
MKIRTVQAHLLSAPLPEPLILPYWGGRRTIVKRDAMLICVQTENGIRGYAPGPAQEDALYGIRTFVAPFLEGRALNDPDALRILFHQQPGVTRALSRLYDAVDLALYDLTARAYDTPLCDLLGGRVRDEIRLYASAGMYQSPQGIADEAASLAAYGFTAYKFRPSQGPEQDLATVQRIRETAGPGLELMVDAHTWWRMGDRNYPEATVHELAREFGRYNIAWLEEPLPPSDHAAYTRLRALRDVPLAAGEHEPDDAGLEDLIESGAVDIVQSDLVCQGGYHTGRRLIASVARAGLSYAFHSWGTALEILAAAHLGICWPDTVVPWLEFPCYQSLVQPGMYPFPLAEDILAEPLPIRKGLLEIDTTRPGLGIDINLTALDRFPWIPGPWSYFQLDSPKETWAVTGDHSSRWMNRV